MCCPDCDTDVHVGTGGISNLNAHRNSKICRENKATKARPPQKKEKSILSFFSRNSIQKNTPLVVSPPPVHAARLHHPESATPISDGDEVIFDGQPHPCPSALELMRELKARVEAMPKDAEPAQRNIRGKKVIPLMISSAHRYGAQE